MPAPKPYGIGLLYRCLKWIGVHTIPDSFSEVLARKAIWSSVDIA